MHDIQSFGMARFELKEDIRKPITFSVDQVNARFVDETMLGSYEYPAIKFMLTQVMKSRIDGQVYSSQAFIHGEREADTHCMSPFEEGLPKGEYIIMYQGEFTEEHPERKLVVSIYTEKTMDNQIPITLIDERSYSLDKWENLDYALFDLFQTYGSEADPPPFDQIQAVFQKGA